MQPPAVLVARGRDQLRTARIQDSSWEVAAATATTTPTPTTTTFQATTTLATTITPTPATIITPTPATTITPILAITTTQEEVADAPLYHGQITMAMSMATAKGKANLVCVISIFAHKLKYIWTSTQQ